jgi:hypothetical protein
MPSKMTVEYLERVWAQYIIDDTCEQCGGNNLTLEDNGKILHCRICGRTVDKFYPKRDNRYKMCVICNCFFIYDSKNHVSENVCDECGPKHHIKHVDRSIDRLQLHQITRICRLDTCKKIFTPTEPNQQHCCKEHSRKHTVIYNYSYSKGRKL